MAAGLLGARVAVLYQIPNQPLFDGLSEDALISYTWMKYLQTGDEDWVCNFAMVKACLRAMDCLEALAQQEWHQKLRGFLLTGASKRGWTTYLTGAVNPERVLAIAPMVFDILNLPVSAQHHLEHWGRYSEMIDDYTEKGLEQVSDVGRGFRLFWMVDPYSYRYRLLMPKLVILGSNDRYWPTDAVNCYWAGLAQPKALLIVPNSGHGLEDTARVVSSIAAFFRLVAKQQPLPEVRWSIEEKPEGLTFRVTSAPLPAESRLWVARAPVRDFRPAKWTELPLPAQGQELVGSVPRAEGQFTAAYGELVYEVDGRKLYLSTQPRVTHPLPK
jgi:PhoPQ-activated pathogenicity-related protein